MSSLEKHPQFRVMQILWAALLTSHMILAVVLWFIRYRPGAAPPHAPPQPLMAPVLGVVALVVAVLSIVIPRTVMQGQIKKLKLTRHSSDEQLAGLMPVAQTTMILGMALCESISIDGLMLGMLGFPIEYTIPFFAVGLLLAAPRYPSANWLRSQVSGTI